MINPPIVTVCGIYPRSYYSYSPVPWMAWRRIVTPIYHLSSLDLSIVGCSHLFITIQELTICFSASNDDATAATEAVHDHESSYSLSRFLDDIDRNHPVGYGQAQSPAESEKRMQKLLHSFEAKFSSGSDAPHGSDSASRS